LAFPEHDNGFGRAAKLVIRLRRGIGVNGLTHHDKVAAAPAPTSIGATDEVGSPSSDAPTQAFIASQNAAKDCGLRSHDEGR
jgi:hypothetical protein